jgi:aspartyl-tRNA(Asn)/glutamyl-tRNA(Gln) amidotransferase subunit A
MTSDYFLDWGTEGLSDGIRDRRLTSVALVSASLAKIEATNGKLHAFVTVFSDSAMERAAALDAETAAGSSRGPLHGLPVAIKDLADIRDRVTGFGSRCYSDTPARSTAPFIKALEDAGAIIIGQTHMVEFAFGSWGTNYAMGTPVNPAGPGHLAPGGSSSGSAVAVASGMVPLAIGSDTGGSVRIPAGLCGVAGMKPSHGLTSLEGVAPLSADLDTIGPLAKDVAGLKFLLDAITTDRKAPAASAPQRRPRRILRLAAGDLEPVHANILDRYDAYLAEVSATLGQAQTLILPLPLAEYQSRCGDLMAHDSYALLHGLIDNPETALDPCVRRRIAVGQSISDRQQQQKLQTRQKDIAEFLTRFGPDDLLILPTTPEPTRPVVEIDETQLPMSRFTRLANYLDLAATSLPLWQVNGLPVGAQFVMRKGNDNRLLALLSDVARDCPAA